MYDDEQSKTPSCSLPFLSFDVAQGHTSQCNNKSKRRVESIVQSSNSNQEVIRSFLFGTHYFRFSHTGRQQSSKASAFSQLLESIKNGKYKRIVVLAGAGISTPSGIPDFRYSLFDVLPCTERSSMLRLERLVQVCTIISNGTIFPTPKRYSN